MLSSLQGRVFMMWRASPAHSLVLKSLSTVRSLLTQGRAAAKVPGRYLSTPSPSCLSLRS